MSILILYFLTLLSYIHHLQHPWLIEAKTRPNDRISINLIHRYSPKSPFYNSSISPKELFQRLVLSSASRHRQIKWQQKNIEAVSTNLISNQGDYLMQISVGTPPVQLVAAAVTGSDITWFQCRPCNLCYRQTTTTFNPKTSKTYRILPCDAEHCTSLDTTHTSCNLKGNMCRFWYTYGNGTTITRGIMGTDTFSFPSSDGYEEQAVFPSISFGCGYQQAGYFNTDSAGVVGLGNGPVSLVSQLGPSIGYRFSYCLTYAASHTVSKLRFGGLLENAPSANESLTVPLITHNPSPFYNLELKGISIGQMGIDMDREIIIDTGTTFTYLDPSMFYYLEAMVNNAIGAIPVSDNPLSEPVLCYDTTTEALTPPDIIFHLNGGDLVLKANNMFFQQDNYLCLSIIRSPEDGDPMVLGNMAQVNLEVGFDLLGKTVSFAPTDCSEEIS